jgi:hypothetical protein
MNKFFANITNIDIDAFLSMGTISHTTKNAHVLGQKGINLPNIISIAQGAFARCAIPGGITFGSVSNTTLNCADWTNITYGILNESS